jgi:hypothetical protein
MKAVISPIIAFYLYLVLMTIFDINAHANGNHEENSHHKTYNYQETYVEDTYIEYRDYDDVMAAQAALSSIPEISHRTGHDKHSGIGFGAGYYEGKQGLAVNIQNMSSCLSLEANFAFAGKEKIYGLGATLSF